MNKKSENSKLVEAMKQFKAVKTVIFREEFYKAVVETNFYVPISVEKSEGIKKGGKYCALNTSDGKKFLCVFTSPQELEKCYGDRDDIVGARHNFVAVREVVIKSNGSLDGLIIDAKGENVAILKEEMIPKK